MNQFSRSISLGLRPAYWKLLARLGDPQKHLPPVFHVAGTNGKGSTCAFLRAILEAAGHRVHVYTSPHLVTYSERIRVAGQLITEEEFSSVLDECLRLAPPEGITQFEALTATALAVFARKPADYTILEVGLGGRLDATNVVEQPLATIITRLSYDHRQFLGSTLAEIAGEKAGIMRKDIPCFTAPQPSEEALTALRHAAIAKETPLIIGHVDWTVEPMHDRFQFKDRAVTLDLPVPGLTGMHQFWNAGLAIEALSVLPRPFAQSVIADGLTKVEWPARLQRLASGNLPDLLPPGTELWLDGGHNDSAGEVLAQQAEAWHRQDGMRVKPLYLVCGMLNTKDPAEFLGPLIPQTTGIEAVAIEGEELSLSAAAVAESAQMVGAKNVRTASSLRAALEAIASADADRPLRVLICGSLYLAGVVLKENAARIY